MRSTEPLPAEALFPAAGGEAAALMRAHDWQSTPLGPAQDWAPGLQVMVRTALTSRHPIFIFWGRHGICLYNDASRPLLGPDRHPALLGAEGRLAWPEAWPTIAPQLDLVLRGEGSIWHENQALPILRHGQLQDVYWTCSYGPIHDAAAPDGIGGVLVIASETTPQVISQRRLRTEREWLAQLFAQAPSFMAVLRGPEHVIELANPAYMRLVGQRPVLGKTVAQAFPEAAEQGYLRLLDEVFRTGEAFSASGAAYVVAGPDGSRDERFVDFVYQPIADATGAVDGIFLDGVDVTDRQRAELALRQSEERLRLASEAAGLAVFLCEPASGRVRWQNDRGHEILGIAPGDEPDAVERLLADFVHPDDAQTLRDRLARTVADGERLQFEARIARRSDGQLRWVEFTGRLQAAAPGAAPLLLGACADISERKEAEDSRISAVAEVRLAALANAKFRAFFDQGSYFAAVLALDGTVLEVNQLALTAGGYTRAEVVGKQFCDCGWWSRSPALVQLVRKGTAMAAAGTVFRREMPYFVAGGDERIVELIIAPIRDDSGNIISLAPTGTDITARKRTEEDLRLLTTALSDADRRKTEFLATLAHELRNPLAPLSSGLHVMRLTADNPATVAKVREMMERQLAHMVRLVDDLLDVARISRGKLDLQKQRVELKSILASAVETSLPNLEAGRHELVVSLPEEPLALNADPARIAQVASNLLNNAAKYTPAGGRIELAARKEGAEVEISVTDNGIGIPSEALQSVFEMFTQVGRDVERADGGLGIGLSLVRQLVVLHGGSVSASSAGRGRGSTLTVRLPLADQEDAANDASAHTPSSSPGVAAPRLRILVVDDNADAAQSLSELLRLGGHDTATAHDGVAALELALEVRPELVFLDIGMPGKNGYEVARELRVTPGFEHTVLVAITGFASAADRLRSRDAGFNEHLTKPADPAVVTQLVSAVCEALARGRF